MTLNRTARSNSNGPIRVEGETTLRVAVVAGLYTSTICLGSVIFPYNSLYTQAVAYTTYFELGEPVIKATCTCRSECLALCETLTKNTSRSLMLQNFEPFL